MSVPTDSRYFNLFASLCVSESNYRELWSVLWPCDTNLEKLAKAIPGMNFGETAHATLTACWMGIAATRGWSLDRSPASLDVDVDAELTANAAEGRSVVRVIAKKAYHVLSISADGKDHELLAAAAEAFNQEDENGLLDITLFSRAISRPFPLPEPLAVHFVQNISPLLKDIRRLCEYIGLEVTRDGLKLNGHDLDSQKGQDCAEVYTVNDLDQLQQTFVKELNVANAVAKNDEVDKTDDVDSSFI